MTKYFNLESRKMRVLAACAALVCAVLIAILSLEATSAKPRFQWSDKVQHFIAYMALTAPLTIAAGRRRVWLAITASGLYGVALEFAQGALTDNRVPSILDAIANVAGAATGAAIAVICIRFVSLRRI